MAAIVDDKYSENEGKMIVNYLGTVPDLTADDIGALVEKNNEEMVGLNIDSEEMFERYDKLLHLLSEEEREEFVPWLYSLLISDGDINLREMDLLKRTCTPQEIQFLIGRDERKAAIEAIKELTEGREVLKKDMVVDLCIWKDLITPFTDKAEYLQN